MWIHLEQLPIEYYHQEFLKHVGKKLGKLLKVDAITSAAIRGRYARVCVQINMANPLPKRVKIGSFWQDIVYENLSMLCYRCSRLGHREPQCTEGLSSPATTIPHENEPTTPTVSPIDPNHVSTPWKTVQTRHTRTRGCQHETTPSGKYILTDPYTLNHPRGQAPASPTQRQCTQNTESVMGHNRESAKQLTGIYCGKVASEGNKFNLQIGRAHV